MKTKSLGMMLALCCVMVLPVDQVQAGRRRQRWRQRVSCCSQPVGNPCPCSSQQVSATGNGLVSYFPDACPIVPTSYDAVNNVWTWDAEKHYGEDRNCTNCLIQIVSLTGDFDVYGPWPYACGDEHCVPASDVEDRARDYSGVRKDADKNPITMEYDPRSDLPDGIRAREIAPRKYVWFTDVSPQKKPRYFIVYSLRIWSPDGMKYRDTRFGHEASKEIFDRLLIPPREIKASHVFPLDKYGNRQDGHSWVYSCEDEDGFHTYVLYLNSRPSS